VLLRAGGSRQTREARKYFFFEKKKQKTFDYIELGSGGARTPPHLFLSADSST
jgi:hypothetical protein